MTSSFIENISLNFNYLHTHYNIIIYELISTPGPDLRGGGGEPGQLPRKSWSGGAKLSNNFCFFTHFFLKMSN